MSRLRAVALVSMHHTNRIVAQWVGSECGNRPARTVSRPGRSGTPAAQGWTGATNSPRWAGTARSAAHARGSRHTVRSTHSCGAAGGKRLHESLEVALVIVDLRRDAHPQPLAPGVQLHLDAVFEQQGVAQ